MKTLKWYDWIPFFWLRTLGGSILAPNWFIFYLYLFYQAIISNIIIWYLILNYIEI
jgi:hypothetical protein